MGTDWLGNQGVVTQGFGACEVACDCPHSGIDVAAPPGTPIIDQIAGVIRNIIDGGGYGLHQVIDIGGGRQIVLGHESAFAVPSGTAVKPGDVVGYVGSTGFSTGPHLHFEEDIGGRPVDPSQALFSPSGIGGSSPACMGLRPGSVERAACDAITGGASAAGPAAGSVGNVAGAISGLPASIGHGLADALAVGVHDIQVFARRQALAAFVGIAVVIALFGIAQPQKG